jgi:hypothetical protein
MRGALLRTVSALLLGSCLGASPLAGVAALAQQAPSSPTAPGAAPVIPADITQSPTSPTTDSAADDTKHASGDATEIAKKLQNPVGDLISVPFSNYTNFNVGPNKGTQDILQIQPVVPIHVTPDWNVITRTVVPLVWSPSFEPAASVPSFGIAPTSFTALLSPKNPVNGWVWGAGPVTQLPTISNTALGSSVWGLGPSFVVVKLEGPIVAGVLTNNIFSLGGTTGRDGRRYSTFLLEPFFNYNFGDGWFAGTTPIITTNWYAAGEKWTLPVGVQGGRVIKLGGKLPLKLEVGGYYNALRPEGAGNWQLLTEAALVF